MSVIDFYILFVCERAREINITETYADTLLELTRFIIPKQNTRPINRNLLSNANRSTFGSVQIIESHTRNFASFVVVRRLAESRAYIILKQNVLLQSSVFIVCLMSILHIIEMIAPPLCCHLYVFLYSLIILCTLLRRCIVP